MRSLLVILACNLGPMGGVAFVQAKCASSTEPAKACCCCPKGEVCRCGCGAPKGGPSSPASQPPVRLICSCDSMPYGPLPDGRFQIEPLKVIEILAVIQKNAGKIFSLLTTEVWASAHGPPPDLPFLRTVILLA